MNKLPEWERCFFNAHSPYTVCKVHPNGIKTQTCLDFRKDSSLESNLEVKEFWELQSATYYNDELILSPKRQLTLEQQWKILNTHPFFTGVCPRCGYQFPSHVPELVHFDCPTCGWIDDSV